MIKDSRKKSTSSWASDRNADRVFENPLLSRKAAIDRRRISHPFPLRGAPPPLLARSRSRVCDPPEPSSRASNDRFFFFFSFFASASFLLSLPSSWATTPVWDSSMIWRGIKGIGVDVLRRLGFSHMSRRADSEGGRRVSRV